MKSIKINTEWWNWIKILSPNEQGEILTNIYRYINDEETITSTSGVAVLWETIRPALDKQIETSAKRKHNMLSVIEDKNNVAERTPSDKEIRPANAERQKITPIDRPAIKETIKEPTDDITSFSSQPVVGTGPKKWQSILDNLGKTKPDDDWVISESNDDW
jgi:flagellar biosynthesis component FlhA